MMADSSVAAATLRPTTLFTKARAQQRLRVRVLLSQLPPLHSTIPKTQIADLHPEEPLVKASARKQSGHCTSHPIRPPSGYKNIRARRANSNCRTGGTREHTSVSDPSACTRPASQSKLTPLTGIPEPRPPPAAVMVTITVPDYDDGHEPEQETVKVRKTVRVRRPAKLLYDIPGAKLGVNTFKVPDSDDEGTDYLRDSEDEEDFMDLENEADNNTNSHHQGNKGKEPADPHAFDDQMQIDSPGFGSAVAWLNAPPGTFTGFAAPSVSTTRDQESFSPNIQELHHRAAAHENRRDFQEFRKRKRDISEAASEKGAISKSGAVPSLGLLGEGSEPDTPERAFSAPPPRSYNPHGRHGTTIHISERRQFRRLYTVPGGYPVEEPAGVETRFDSEEPLRRINIGYLTTLPASCWAYIRQLWRYRFPRSQTTEQHTGQNTQQGHQQVDNTPEQPNTDAAEIIAVEMQGGTKRRAVEVTPASPPKVASPPRAASSPSSKYNFGSFENDEQVRKNRERNEKEEYLKQKAKDAALVAKYAAIRKQRDLKESRSQSTATVDGANGADGFIPSHQPASATLDAATGADGFIPSHPSAFATLDAAAGEDGLIPSHPSATINTVSRKVSKKQKQPNKSMFPKYDFKYLESLLRMDDLNTPPSSPLQPAVSVEPTTTLGSYNLEGGDNTQSTITERKTSNMETLVLKAEGLHLHKGGDSSREAEEAAERARKAEEVEAAEKARKAEEEARKAEELRVIRAAAAIMHLSHEQTTAIFDALSSSTGRAVRTVEKVDLSKATFDRILSKENSRDAWLNDDAVNAWYAALVRALNLNAGYGAGTAGNDAVPPFAALNSAWTTKMSKKEQKQGLKTLLRWLKKQGLEGARLLKCKRLFLPINDGSHWTLLIINGTDLSIEYLDSLGGKGKDEFDMARELLKAALGKDFHAPAWTDLHRNRSSMQANVNDCGVFTCFNGLAAAKDLKYQVIKAEEMPQARLHMAGVLINGGFSGAYGL